MYTELKDELLKDREDFYNMGNDIAATVTNDILNHVIKLDEQYQKDAKGFGASGDALALTLNLKHPEQVKVIQDVVQHLVLAQNQSRMLLEIIDHTYSNDQPMTAVQHKLVDRMKAKLL